MSKRAMIADAFLPTWAWNAKLRAADSADRWKLHVLRIGAGVLAAILLLLVGARNPRLW